MIEQGLIGLLDHLTENVQIVEDDGPKLRNALVLDLTRRREALVDELVLALLLARDVVAGDDLRSLGVKGAQLFLVADVQVVHLLVQLDLRADAIQLELLEGVHQLRVDEIEVHWEEREDI